MVNFPPTGTPKLLKSPLLTEKSTMGEGVQVGTPGGVYGTKQEQAEDTLVGE